ncbi:MAG: adenosine deaminase [Gemmatimonadota bacterium]|nr:adenosine deaminase [Gemmatimonadota bacterium]
MPVLSRELLRALPKAELHCHLDGSVRPSTLIELGAEYGQPMPADDAETLREFMLVRDARHLEDYLARFAFTLSVMQHAESLERIAYELMEDAAHDGVRYLEMRFAPVLNQHNGLSLGAAVEAPLRGIARAEREHGIIGRVIVVGLRNQPPDISLELARLAVAYRNRGVVGFDLAGGEAGNPASVHAAAFSYAREHDMAVTVHAGEGAGAESVREAVHICGANRIGHATHLIDDPSLTQYVNDRRITLEICLTSNVQTRAVPDYESHPLRSYYDDGLNVVLNTDNRLMSGTTLTDEYFHAARHLDFTMAELAEIALNGFTSAFLPWQERETLVTRVRAEIAALSGAK